ncbi:hypothetical protein BH18ACI5_BH18ACI5_26570 [soil metagenome]
MLRCSASSLQGAHSPSALLLTALDGEALYTIASDIKPMSSGRRSIDALQDRRGAAALG